MWSFSGFALVALLSASSDSATPSARLVYVRNAGAEACPDEIAVRAAVGVRLGYDPFVAHAPATLFAEISRSSKGYRSEIKLVGADNSLHGARELEHPTERCADVIDVMALSISIALDPRSFNARSQNESARPSAENPSTSPRAPAVPTPVRREETERPGELNAPSPLHVQAGLGANVWFGSAPTMNGGANVFGRLRYGTLSAALEGRIDLPASRYVAPVQVETWMAAGSLVPCLHYKIFAGCGVLTAGAIFSRGGLIAAPVRDSALHLLAGARAAVELPVFRSLSLWINANGLFALIQHRLTVDGIEAYRLPLFSGGLGIGFIIHFL